MSAGRRRFRPSPDGLESRLLLAPRPSNVIASEVGVVPSPNAVGRTTTTVVPRNLSGRGPGTLIGLAARPEGGSHLLPRLVNGRAASGKPLPFLHQAGFRPGRGPSRAVVRVSDPGPFTTGVTGRADTIGSYLQQSRLLGDLDGNGVVNSVDLRLFPGTYLSRFGQPNYNINADANLNGVIGIGDGRALLRNLREPGPPRPLNLDLRLAPEDAFRGSGPKNSGGVTLKKEGTILGHTVPHSIIVTDTGLGDFTYRGGAAVSDAQGNFSSPFTNTDGINQHQFLVITPYGQQTNRTFPILWMGFGRGTESGGGPG